VSSTNPGGPGKGADCNRRRCGGWGRSAGVPPAGSAASRRRGAKQNVGVWRVVGGCPRCERAVEIGNNWERGRLAGTSPAFDARHPAALKRGRDARALEIGRYDAPTRQNLPGFAMAGTKIASNWTDTAPNGPMPHQIGPMPHQIGPMPHQIGPMPHQIGSMPHQIGSMPLQIGSMPLQIGSISHQIGSIPHQIGSISHQIGSIPHQIGSIPLQNGPIPHRIGSIPQRLTAASPAKRPFSLQPPTGAGESAGETPALPGGLPTRSPLPLR
jgi:hypothetical protein